MLALVPAKPDQLSGVFDPLIESVTGTAVEAATAASGPLLDDIEIRVRKLLLPIVLFSAASLLFTMLTYRDVHKKNKSLAGSRR